MTDTSADGRSFWQRSLAGWHAAYYGLLAVLAVLWVFADTTTSRRATALGLLALLAVLYHAIGRRFLGADNVFGGLAYLVPTWVILGALLWMDGGSYVLLFVLFPQIWALLPARWAVGFLVVGVPVLAVVQVAASDWTAAAVRQALFAGVIQISLSLLLGLWISGTIKESEQRAELIKELTRARSELAAAEHDRGVLAERQRLAHEIHDTLAQGFTSILTLAQAIEIALPNDPDAARKRLSLLEQTARENLSEARALVADLGPVDLAASTLEEAVRRLVQRFGREVGVEASLEVTGAPRALPANAEVVLLRAVQESLANVRKHARARSVRVRLAYDHDAVTLEVVDDGRGFQPDTQEGFGLRGMRSRVEQVGGELTVASVIGRGTKVQVRLP